MTRLARPKILITRSEMQSRRSAAFSREKDSRRVASAQVLL